MNDTDDKGSHIAICGGFNNLLTIAEVNEGELDTYFDSDDKLSGNSIDEKFKTYLDDKLKEAKVIQD